MGHYVAMNEKQPGEADPGEADQDGLAPNTDVTSKQLAGRHAAGFVRDGMTVGLGTGSTVHHTIVALGEAGLDITCTATSQRTYDLATSLGLRVVPPDALGRLDIAIDGADEVDRELNLTKGGGGAHTREKIVASMADRFVVVVDDTKLVERLGPFGTPLEVLDFAPGVVIARLEALGSTPPRIREARSDNGNLLIDAYFGPIDDPVEMARRLDAIPGVVEHGIFPNDMVSDVVVATPNGVELRIRPPAPTRP